MRYRALLLMLAACATKPAPSPPTIVVAAPAIATASIEKDDVDEARRGVLAMLDAGDLDGARSSMRGQKTPVARALVGVRPSVFANAPTHRIGEVPPPRTDRTDRTDRTKSPKQDLLAGTILPTPQSFSVPYMEAKGRYFSEGSSSGSGDGIPAWLPARIGAVPLMLLRATDGRWLAQYDHRYLAVVGEDAATILDFDQHTIRAANISGDLLVVCMTHWTEAPVLVGIDVKTGSVRWRQDNLADEFAIGDGGVIALRGDGAHPTEIVSLSKDTGQILARRPVLPKAKRGAQLIAVKGHIYFVPEDQIHPGAVRGEVIELQMTAAESPAPKEPSPPAKIPAVPTPPSDMRLRAWSQLDKGDARAAILTLRAARTSDLATMVLSEASLTTLEAQRKEAADAILAHTPWTPGGPALGRAPIARSRTRRLAVVAKKAISAEHIADEFPTPSDDDLVPPAYVPITIGNRKYNADASFRGPDHRVDVYWGYGKPAWSVLSRNGAFVSTIEHRYESRASGVAGDVVLSIVNVGGHMRLEAIDAKTGAYYYQGRDELSDSPFVVEDGYVIASSVRPSGTDVVLIEADTGTVVQRAPILPSTMGFLVFRSRDGKIMAVSDSASVVLSLD